MSHNCLRWLLTAASAAGICLIFAASARAEVTAEEVLDSIERGKKYLVNAQNPLTGSWFDQGTGPNHPVGVASLAVLALINSGMTAEDPPVARGLVYLRGAAEPQETYDISLMIMALAAAREGTKDEVRIARLAHQLEKSQLMRGSSMGGWTYRHEPRINCDFSS